MYEGIQFSIDYKRFQESIRLKTFIDTATNHAQKAAPKTKQ